MLILPEKRHKIIIMMSNWRWETDIVQWSGWRKYPWADTPVSMNGHYPNDKWQWHWLRRRFNQASVNSTTPAFAWGTDLWSIPLWSTWGNPVEFTYWSSCFGGMRWLRSIQLNPLINRANRLILGVYYVISENVRSRDSSLCRCSEHRSRVSHCCWLMLNPAYMCADLGRCSGSFSDTVPFTSNMSFIVNLNLSKSNHYLITNRIVDSKLSTI